MQSRPTRRWFQFSLASLFLVMTAVAVWFGLGPSIRLHLAVRQLSNADVDVDGTYFGLMLNVHGDAAKCLREFKTRVNRPLRAALGDPDKFAAAHILLTDTNEPKYNLSASEWNHMRITLYADGRTDFHIEQMAALQKYWDKKLGAND